MPVLRNPPVTLLSNEYSNARAWLPTIPTTTGGPRAEQQPARRGGRRERGGIACWLTTPALGASGSVAIRAAEPRSAPAEDS